MTKRSDDFIKRAEHCLRTGQPTIASRYMQIAADDLEAERTRPLNEIQEVRTIQFRRMVDHITENTMPEMMNSLKRFGESIRLSISAVLPGLMEAVKEQNERNLQEMKLVAESIAPREDRLHEAARKAMREAPIEEDN